MLIDVAFLIFVAFFTIKYYKQGFAVSLLSIGRIVCALAASFMFGGILSSVLKEFFIETAVFGAISHHLSSFESERFMMYHDGFVSVAGILSEGISLDKCEITEAVSNWISALISGVLAYSGLFILVFLLFTLFINAVKLIKVPILEKADGILGAAYGFSLATVLSAVTVTLIYSALIAASSSLGVGGALIDIFDQSVVFNLIYNSGSQGILDGLI